MATPTKPQFQFRPRVILFWLPLLLVSAVGYYFLFGQGALNSLVNQTQFRQLALVRSGRSSLEAYLRTIRSSTLVLASQIDSKGDIRPDNIQDTLDDFARAWTGTPTVEAAFINDAGFLVALSEYPEYHQEPPLEVNDRDYIIWSKTASAGETLAATPAQPRTGKFQDQYVIPYVTPVFAEDGTRLGTLVIVLSLSEITKAFIIPLKITPQSRVYLIDSQGRILFSPYAELQGVDYIDYLRKQNFPGASLIAGFLLKTAGSVEEGTFQVVLPNIETRSLSTMLIAHVPIYYDAGEHWTLAMATPLDASLSFIVPLYLNQIGILIASLLILIAYAVYFAKRFAYRQAAKELGR